MKHTHTHSYDMPTQNDYKQQQPQQQKKNAKQKMKKKKPTKIPERSAHQDKIDTQFYKGENQMNTEKKE